jgi:hypothetical protein
MQCKACQSNNESDALFCSECGKPLAETTPPPGWKQKKPYLFALLFLPVLALAVAVGYYKYFLPDGVAAVVNGEEIRLSELNAAVSRVRGGSEADSAGLRYQALNELITERLALQEARKAGIQVSKDEVKAAVMQAQKTSGLEADQFSREIKSLHGTLSGFERVLERRLLINRLITEKVVPPGADSRTANRAISRWLRDLSAKAAVRIALAEQWSGGGCGCCNKGNGQAMPGGKNTAQQPATEKTRAASAAGLQYWKEKHGPETVDTRLTDFGCHIQVDIVKNEKVVGSLRYQGGAISEL